MNNSTGIAPARFCIWLVLSSFLSLSLFVVGTANAASVAGVSLEDNITTADGTALVLNGAGIRKKLFFKLYVGSLYVSQDMQGADANTIVAGDENMLIQMNIRSELLTRDKMVAAIESGLKKSTGNNTAAIQPQIDTLESALDEALVPGDVLQIVYNAESDTTTFIKNEETKAQMPGLDFKKALFGIWLSNTPVQASLKSAMLGG